jgi:hypothetical protein
VMIALELSGYKTMKKKQSPGTALAAGLFSRPTELNELLCH